MSNNLKTKMKTMHKLKTQKVLPLIFSALVPFACFMPQDTLCAASKEEAVLNNNSIKNWPSDPTIKVLVLQDVEGALVEVKGSYNIYDPRTGKKLDSAFSSSTYYMHPTTDGIKWGVEFPGVFQVLIVPDSPTTTVLVHGIEYRGMVYAYQADGTIGFVNQVILDDYTNSCISSRSQGKLTHPEAISALAIALRTDALYKSQHGKTKYWDVKASQVGYQGQAVVSLEKPYVDAFKMTSKMVLQNVQPISWFNGKMELAPVQEIQSQASEGKDARSILNRFFPDNHIVLSQNK